MGILESRDHRPAIKNDKCRGDLWRVINDFRPCRGDRVGGTVRCASSWPDELQVDDA
jgi:hypothetical protein